jgi:hypothetical protein
MSSASPKVYEYRGTAYRQNVDAGTPWILSFVAIAEELVEWAGIPRRSDDNLAGFQRAYDPARVAKAKSFFDIPQNQSPTAIIVGIHPSDEAIVSLTLDDAAATICGFTLRVTHDSRLDLADAVPTIRRHIAQRLAVEGPDIAVPDELEDTTKDDAPEDGDKEEIELGRSLLHELDRRLDDIAWRTSNAEALLDMAKPATVIDGQHRLKGAEKCERGIPFTVCALWNCQWAEQVFQFTVVNYTQHGIPDQFITANAALSLTQSELLFLQRRLVQAGVNVVEYDLMKVVQFHDESPFKELVNLTERKDPSKIGYKTMVRLANAWYGAKHPVFRLLLTHLYPNIPAKNAHKQRLTKWKEDDWGLFFLDFWKIAHDTYAAQPAHDSAYTLWSVGHSNLIVAIVLYEFQQAFFDNLNAQDEEFFVPRASGLDEIHDEFREKLKRRARKFVEYFPADFFARPWGFSSLSIGPGRKALQDAFQRLVNQKGQYQYEKSALITGQT